MQAVHRAIRNKIQVLPLGITTVVGCGVLVESIADFYVVLQIRPRMFIDGI